MYSCMECTEDGHAERWWCNDCFNDHECDTRGLPCVTCEDCEYRDVGFQNSAKSCRYCGKFLLGCCWSSCGRGCDTVFCDGCSGLHVHLKMVQLRAERLGDGVLDKVGIVAINLAGEEILRAEFDRHAPIRACYDVVLQHLAAEDPWAEVGLVGISPAHTVAVDLTLARPIRRHRSKSL